MYCEESLGSVESEEGLWAGHLSNDTMSAGFFVVTDPEDTSASSRVVWGDFSSSHLCCSPVLWKTSQSDAICFSCTSLKCLPSRKSPEFRMSSDKMAVPLAFETWERIQRPLCRGESEGWLGISSVWDGEGVVTPSSLDEPLEVWWPVKMTALCDDPCVLGSWNLLGSCASQTIYIDDVSSGWQGLTAIHTKYKIKQLSSYTSCCSKLI